MRFRAGIGTLMIGVAAVGLGLFAFLEWRREVSTAPSEALRIAREVLAERSAGRTPGRSTADSAAIAAFILSAVAASKVLRTFSGRRADSFREGPRAGR